jgi:pyruvate dehydrogenase E1 component alpha subunit
LIEAVTYRIGPHTTADDPGRYRSSEEGTEWARRDPLERVRLYLSERDAWSDSWQSQIEDEATAEIDRAFGLAEQMPPLAVGEIFDAVFEEPTPNLRRQQSEAGAGTR